MLRFFQQKHMAGALSWKGKYNATPRACFVRQREHVWCGCSPCFSLPPLLLLLLFVCRCDPLNQGLVDWPTLLPVFREVPALKSRMALSSPKPRLFPRRPHLFVLKFELTQTTSNVLKHTPATRESYIW